MGTSQVVRTRLPRALHVALIISLLALLAVGPAGGATPRTFPGEDGLVAFTSNPSGDFDVFVTDVESGVARRLTDTSHHDVTPSISRDGRWILFSREVATDDYDILRVPVTGGDAQAIVDGPTTDSFPRWHPDGQHLVFVSGRDGDDEIYSVGVDGRDLVRLTASPGVDSTPAVSPDGSQIAFASNRSGSMDIWVMGVDGTNPQQITDLPVDALLPRWSPDGGQLLFAADADVWVVPATGGTATNLTMSTDYEWAPTWSPTGDQVLFISDRSGRRHIWRTDAATFTDASLITDIGGEEGYLDWGPAAVVDVVRLSGPSRVETAVAIAEHAFPTGANAVVLARADTFPDALAGGPLARQVGGPVLLTNSTSLHPATRDAILSLLANDPDPVVHLLGGTAALSSTVEAEVAALGVDVVRLEGPTRFHTAVAIAPYSSSAATRWLADGGSFQDALLAGAAGAIGGGPVLLTSGSTMPEATADYLNRTPNTMRVAVGAPASAADPSSTRLIGSDPSATSVEVARWVQGTRPSTVSLASSEAFPDGLAGGPHAGSFDGALLLTPPDMLDADVAQYLAETAARRLFVYGGPAAVSDAVIEQAITAMTSGS